MISDPAEGVGGQLTGQGIKPIAHRRIGFKGLPQVFHKYLAGAGQKLVSFQAVQIEGFYHP
jgi:hypothetical protein